MVEMASGAVELEVEVEAEEGEVRVERPAVERDALDAICFTFFECAMSLSLPSAGAECRRHGSHSLEEKGSNRDWGFGVPHWVRMSAVV